MLIQRGPVFVLFIATLIIESNRILIVGEERRKVGSTEGTLTGGGGGGGGVCCNPFHSQYKLCGQ